MRRTDGKARGFWTVTGFDGAIRPSAGPFIQNRCNCLRQYGVLERHRGWRRSVVGTEREMINPAKILLGARGGLALTARLPQIFSFGRSISP
jgi:hypothetical protein